MVVPKESKRLSSTMRVREGGLLLLCATWLLGGGRLPCDPSRNELGKSAPSQARTRPRAQLRAQEI